MNDDRDFGPAIGGGARRDPRLSIRRERPQRPDSPQVLSRSGVPAGWIGHALLAIAILAVIGVALFLLGILLHVAWDAIMVGWTFLR